MPVILIFAALGVWWLVRSVRRRRESGPLPERGAVGWVIGTRWRTLVPLARAENRQLIRHPVFVTVNNKAEGSASLSVFELARQLAL